MTTQKNQTHSESGEQFERTKASHESEPDGPGSGRLRGNRRKFLHGVGIVGMISLSGCTVDENGISWGDQDSATDTPTDQPTDTPVDESTDTPENEPTDTPDEEPSEEDDEMDLSEYEDGCFSGGIPQVSSGVRDGVEITATAAGVDNQIQLLRETFQYQYDDELVLRDDVDLQLPDEEDEDDDPMVIEAELVEDDEDEEDDDEPIVLEAELVEVDEDEEDDDE